MVSPADFVDVRGFSVSIRYRRFVRWALSTLIGGAALAQLGGLRALGLALTHPFRSAREIAVALVSLPFALNRTLLTAAGLTADSFVGLGPLAWLLAVLEVAAVTYGLYWAVVEYGE